MNEEKPQEDAGTASMFLLWHCELKPPIVLMNMDEVRVYIQLMRTIGKGTPRFCEVPFNYEI